MSEAASNPSSPAAILAADDLRRAARHAWNRRIEVTLHERNDGSRARTILVDTHDISATGIGFQYRNFVHQGTQVWIRFPQLNENLVVRGVVVYCRYLSDGSHKIGVKFTGRSVIEATD